MPIETFTIQSSASFRAKLNSYLRAFEVFAVLDSNGYFRHESHGQKPFYHSYDLLAGIGAKDIFSAKSGQVFSELEKWKAKGPGWVFGYFGYDLKNEIEKLHSSNHDGAEMPDAFFFRPEIRLALQGDTIEIEAEIPEDIWQAILRAEAAKDKSDNMGTSFTPRMPRTDYLKAVEAIRDHIFEGDVYEVNLCQEFYAEKMKIDPFLLCEKVNKQTPQPFSAFLRFGDKYVVCASMERFLKKQGRKLISQPIKGTIRRGSSQEEDIRLQNQLAADEKERSENVMIVDLVRNDLSRSSIPGTVQVEELCKVYAFPFVNQMISTVTSTLSEEVNSVEAIRNAFPMGSMTGAPKIAAMEFIEKYEHSRRGVYSGAIGYFTPEDDFDLNVVIRTFVYDAGSGYLSVHAGSAITYDSDAQKEYEECLLKIKGLLAAAGAGIAGAEQ
jgi:para-aminobenzoate synthetase component 1